MPIFTHAQEMYMHGLYTCMGIVLPRVYAYRHSFCGFTYKSWIRAGLYTQLTQIYSAVLYSWTAWCMLEYILTHAYFGD